MNQILRYAFPNWQEGEGIFDKIMELAVMPWSDDTTVTSAVLDMEYFGNRSGSKFCSPIVKKLLNVDGEVSDSARDTLARIIIAKYRIPWTRLWMTNEVTYSPINNYDMQETRNLMKNTSEGELSTENESHTGTDTLQHGKTETTTHGKTTEELDSKYGFNTQDEPKPSDLATVTEGGTTAVADTGSDVNTKNLADTSLVNKNRAGAEEEQEVTHRVGNIGVTTNQKLISEERNLWLWNFFDQVFKDIDSELTLSIFDPCRA